MRSTPVNTPVKKMATKKKLLKNQNQMANILSNFEARGPTEVSYIYIKKSVFPNYFRLRTEGVLPAPASQSLIY